MKYSYSQITIRNEAVCLREILNNPNGAFQIIQNILLDHSAESIPSRVRALDKAATRFVRNDRVRARRAPPPTAPSTIPRRTGRRIDREGAIVSQSRGRLARTVLAGRA